MQEEHLTVDQCDELAKALREHAARLPHGSERENLLQLVPRHRGFDSLQRTDFWVCFGYARCILARAFSVVNIHLMRARSAFRLLCHAAVSVTRRV